MIRPKKRQKFGGFKLSEDSKHEIPKEDEDEEDDNFAEKGHHEAKAEEASPVGPSERFEPNRNSARPALASLLVRAEAAAAAGDVEGAFEPFGAASAPEEGPEQTLLEDLREALAIALPIGQLELVPAGSFATGLRLPKFGLKSARDDFEIALLFPASLTEAEGDHGEAESVVDGVIAWLRTQPGTVIKEIFRKARSPAVIFETKQLAVQISIQNPFGLLSSWHMRDLCQSGWPGRLRAVAQLVKLWALSKSIDSPKDGGLGPHGYELLAAAYLQDCGALPALLPWTGPGPYLEPEDAMGRALGARAGAAPGDLWRPAGASAADLSEAAGWHPTQFVLHWLDWMADTVLGFVETCRDLPVSCGKAPLDRRHIVSVRDRTQDELREDVAMAPTAEEHWSPESQEVFLLIEDPLSGANAGHCVWFKGFCAIRAEVQRARKFLESTPLSKAGLPNFQSLLALPPLSRATQQQQQPIPVGIINNQTFKLVQDGPGGSIAKLEASDLKASSICWDFARGNCKKGAKCKWVHMATGEDQNGE